MVISVGLELLTLIFPSHLRQFPAKIVTIIDYFIE